MYKRILIVLFLLANSPFVMANIASDIANKVPINKAVQHAIEAEESLDSIVAALQAAGFSVDDVVNAMVGAGVEPMTIVIVMDSIGVDAVTIATAMSNAGIEDSINIVATALDIHPADVVSNLAEALIIDEGTAAHPLLKKGGGAPENENNPSPS